MTLLTLTQTAAVIGLSRIRTWELVRDGRIKATRVGSAWLIGEQDAWEFRDIPRPPGAPRLASDAQRAQNHRESNRRYMRAKRAREKSEKK